MSTGEAAPDAVEWRHVTKRFGRLLAVDDVSLRLRAGALHAVVGQNGAGKTTLMNLLCGVLPMDKGQVWVRGRPVRYHSPRAALDDGVGMVSQHYALVGALSVLENLMLQTSGRRWGRLPRTAVRDQAQRVADQAGFSFEWDRPAEALTVTEQQRLEILRLLIRDAQVLVFDEPTAVLPPDDAEAFYRLARALVDGGRTVIVVTHRLADVLEHADTVTVMREGRVQSALINDQSLSINSLTEAIMGADIPREQPIADTVPSSDQVMLSLEGVTCRPGRDRCGLRGVSLQVHQGEVLGLAGVDGNGQMDLVDVLLGLQRAVTGQIKLNDVLLNGMTTRQRLHRGIRYITEDRMGRGIALEWSIHANVLMGYQRSLFRHGVWLHQRASREAARRIVDRFDVKCDGIDAPMGSLSGGNQQRVVVGRGLLAPGRLLIAAHPDRGLDAGSSEQVYRAILNACRDGACCLLLSHELDALPRICHRVAVMYDGRIAGVLDSQAANRTTLGQLMTGGTM